MAAKSGGKTIFGKKSPVDSADTLWVKHFIKIALSRSVSKINAFFCFTQIQDGRQKWRENDFWKKSLDSADTLWVKNFVEIALSHSVSEINPYLRLMQKFKMATKSGGKMIFGKSRQYTLQIF